MLSTRGRFGVDAVAWAYCIVWNIIATETFIRLEHEYRLRNSAAIRLSCFIGGLCDCIRFLQCLRLSFQFLLRLFAQSKAWRRETCSQNNLFYFRTAISPQLSESWHNSSLLYSRILPLQFLGYCCSFVSQKQQVYKSNNQIIRNLPQPYRTYMPKEVSYVGLGSRN